jgi:hypothetical protein
MMEGRHQIQSRQSDHDRMSIDDFDISHFNISHDEPSGEPNDVPNEDHTPMGGYKQFRDPDAAWRFGKTPTLWDDIRAQEDPAFLFKPWANKQEYEMVVFLSSNGLSQGAIDRFLQLEYVRGFIAGLFITDFPSDWTGSFATILIFLCERNV